MKKKKKQRNQKPLRGFTRVSERFGFPFFKNHSDYCGKSWIRGSQGQLAMLSSSVVMVKMARREIIEGKCERWNREFCKSSEESFLYKCRMDGVTVTNIGRFSGRRLGLGGRGFLSVVLSFVTTWTPDLSTWLNQLRQFSQCVLLLSLLVRSAAVPAGTFCYSLDLMQGYWVPWSPTQLVPPCLNFLVGRLWLFILLGSLGHQHLLSPSLFFLLHHPGDCLQLLTSKPAVVLQTPFSPLFPLYLGVQLALSFQNPLSGPFLLSLLWTWPCLLGKDGPQGMINGQAEFFKNSGILST